MPKLIIGIATGSNDIETWLAPQEKTLCDKLCETIVRGSGRSVYIIEGTVIGKYEMQLPVVYKTDLQDEQ